MEGRVPRGAWVVWGTGVLAYSVAVLHRTSLGVAGLEASERFGAGASAVALFVVLQLLVYAAMQVPVGVLLDRFGSRRLVLTGALLMSAGQLLLAVAQDLPTAVAARVLVGAGDAMTFISVLRLVAAWFPPRRNPLVVQLTGILGQLGQVASAVPLAAVLHDAGWSAAYGSAAATGLLVAVLVLAVLRDRPPGYAGAAPPPGLSTVRRDLVAAWRHPGTRLGLWSHFTTQFSGVVFGLLWGVPFLVSAQGLSPEEASGVLTLLVLAGIASGPVLGHLIGAHPLRRSWIVLGITGATALSWTVLLSLSEPAPRWLLVVHVLVLAVGGPASMVGFDYARTSNPPERLGGATGIVNVGGFVASLVTVLGVGVVVDVVGGGRYDLDAFRAAFAVQYVVWAVGVVGVLRTRTLTRRLLAAEGVHVPPVRQAWARERRRRAARRGGG